MKRGNTSDTYFSPVIKCRKVRLVSLESILGVPHFSAGSGISKGITLYDFTALQTRFWCRVFLLQGRSLALQRSMPTKQGGSSLIYLWYLGNL